MASRLVSVDSEGREGAQISVHAPRDRQSVYTLRFMIEANDFNGSVATASRAVQVVPEGGSAMDVTDDLAVTSTGAQGTVRTALAEETSYTLQVSLADNLGHVETVETTFYVPLNADSITPPNEPDSAGWISGVIYDSATCNHHLTDCQGMAGVQVTLELVDVQALQQVRQARAREIQQRWMSNRAQFTPLAPTKPSNITTSIPGTIVTGADGFFAFPVGETAVYWLRAEKEGYTYGQREAEVVLERSSATNAIYLTPIDLAMTPCDETGCTHSSSDGMIEVEIPAGAIADGESLEVTATNFEQVEYLPSGELPTGRWETYAFNLGGDSDYQFQPGKQAIIRIQNTEAFALGTQVPLGFWNEATQDWEHSGTGIVDGTGQWTWSTHRKVRVQPMHRMNGRKRSRPEMLPESSLQKVRGNHCVIHKFSFT
jgi:hypothetical protein